MLDSCKANGRHFVSRLGLIAFLVALVFQPAAAQNRVDLDDLTIKGELLNDNRLRISSREAHKITDRVSYRNNFRKEITDSLEIAWPAKEPSRAAASVDDKGGTP